MYMVEWEAEVGVGLTKGCAGGGVNRQIQIPGISTQIDQQT